MHGFIKLYISVILLFIVVFSAGTQTATASARKGVAAAQTAVTPGEIPKAPHQSSQYSTTDDMESCPHPFNLSCYYQHITRTSHCECILPIRADSMATAMQQSGIAKHCNSDMSRCAYVYETGNRCRKDWKFKCNKTGMPGFDWECSCEGWLSEDEECPSGYERWDRWCWKFWYYKSMFTERVEPLRSYIEVGSDTRKVLIKQDFES